MEKGLLTRLYKVGGDLMELTEEQKNDETKWIIIDIQKLKPHPTEVITLFYEINSFSEIKNIFDYVKNYFPENKVIVLPNKVGLESCSKDVLENIISMISEIIEEL